MNDCATIRPELGPWLDDALSAEEVARIEGHLAVCATCREEVNALRALTQAIGRLQDPKPSPLIRARVFARATAESHPHLFETRCVERDGNRQVERHDSRTLSALPSPGEPFPARVVQYHRQVSADGKMVLTRTSQTA